MDGPHVTSYDRVNYPSFPIAYTHPDRLATIATLFGMKPAPVEKCRVLELGCFDGTNLAAMAVGLPQCEFVGVDLAGTAIARGRGMAEDVGLKNLTLRHIDLMKMAPDCGVFDYIIAHGIFSWVPAPVRQQILAICKGSLAPQGVAYISYNAFPGCHYRLMLRRMMQFHNRDFPDPQQQTDQAINLLKVLANSLENESEPYAQLLKGELELLSKRSREAFYHDELAEVYVPLYFHQFMEQAHHYDLQFLGEADFSDMVPRRLTPQAVEILDRMSGDVILREQYLDFMRGHCFRRTLLCHKDVVLTRDLKPDCVRSYYVSTLAKATSSTPNLEPGAKETFQNQTGEQVTSADPLGRTLFWHLAEKVAERIPFPRLVTEVESRARQRLGYVPKPEVDTAAEIAEFIWAMYGAGLVDLHLFVPPFVTHVSDRPTASPLARWQARHGDHVATLNHRLVKLVAPIPKGLLPLMDGSRDRAALRADALQVFASGALDLADENGKPVTDMSIAGKAIDAHLEEFLKTAAEMAVLMG